MVCCSYGEKAEITIRFENGTEQKFSGKQFGRDILQEFSDERYNPQNQKGVLNIELTSPLFDFGKDVLLVDSPGLDAFGLEAHERLGPRMSGSHHGCLHLRNDDEDQQRSENSGDPKYCR